MSGTAFTFEGFGEPRGTGNEYKTWGSGKSEKGPEWLENIFPSPGKQAPVVTVNYYRDCSPLVINFGAEPAASIISTMRDIFAGLLYIGAILVFIKLLRSLEF